ncbi:MAG TPA: hypothetical protein VJ792_05235 [Candidatus Nitrosotalea sp.]|nr:hypothetical protein [Candidatus Nitrosotalea sp.]
MFPRTNKRKAISAVLTTLIILVASVVLGTGVVLYGTSLFQTSSQSSGITTTGVNVWADASGSSGWAWGSADVRNSGDKILSIDTIQVRGQAVPFSNWYADTNSSQVTTSNFQAANIYTAMLVTPNSLNGALKNGTGFNAGWATPAGCTLGTGNLILQLQTGNPVLCLKQQTGPVSLVPGAKAIIYFEVPQNVMTAVDAGAASSVAIYAGGVGAPQSVTVQSK